MSDDVHSIVVATDLSPRSDRAIDRAFQLGREKEAAVHVVHVVEPESTISPLDVRRVLPDPSAKVDIRLPYGPAPRAIADTARSVNAGLIVTGVARFNTLTDFVTGTAVDHLVRNADCPVLVVKQRAQAPYQRLLVATDFSKGAKAALLAAARLFPNAELHLVHAYHVPFESRLKSQGVRDIALEEAEKKLEGLLSELPGDLLTRVKPKLASGETSRVIAQAVGELWPDLVVIGAHGVSGFVQATLGSVASDLLARVTPDTLVVPNR